MLDVFLKISTQARTVRHNLPVGFSSTRREALVSTSPVTGSQKRPFRPLPLPSFTCSDVHCQQKSEVMAQVSRTCIIHTPRLLTSACGSLVQHPSDLLWHTSLHLC